MIIGIDFNNVIQNQIGTIVALSGHKLTYRDFDRWDPPIGHKIGMSEPDFIDWAWKNPELQMMAYPFEGVKEAIDRLKTAGHEIRIITSTILRPSQVISWLDRFQIKFDNIIFTKDKSQAQFDVLIDDSPIVINQMLEIGRPIVKFSIPWNEGIIDCPSISSWEEMVGARLLIHGSSVLI